MIEGNNQLNARPMFTMPKISPETRKIAREALGVAAITFVAVIVIGLAAAIGGGNLNLKGIAVTAMAVSLPASALFLAIRLKQNEVSKAMIGRLYDDEEEHSCAKLWNQPEILVYDGDFSR